MKHFNQFFKLYTVLNLPFKEFQAIFSQKLIEIHGFSLLDLSAAFDLVDHEVLLRRLEISVGFRGVVLQWFRSYLTNRCFSVRTGHQLSSSVPLNRGVPQGSVLGPVLFTLYMLPLASICNKYGVSFHLYADDTQIYFPLKHNDKNGSQLLLALSLIHI